MDKYRDDIYIFDIKVHDVKFRHKGIGTFLMSEAAKWCHINNISFLCGKLDFRDKTNNNWETSLPFYNNLPRKTQYIKKCYFLQSLIVLEKTKDLKKESKSSQETFETGGIVVFSIK